MIYLNYGRSLMKKPVSKEDKNNLVINEDMGIISNSKVTGSVIYRTVSPEDRKKIKEIAKKKAKEMGLIINIIEK